LVVNLWQIALKWIHNIPDTIDAWFHWRYWPLTTTEPTISNLIILVIMPYIKLLICIVRLSVFIGQIIHVLINYFIFVHLLQSRLPVMNSQQTYQQNALKTLTQSFDWSHPFSMSSIYHGLTCVVIGSTEIK